MHRVTSFYASLLVQFAENLASKKLSLNLLPDLIAQLDEVVSLTFLAFCGRGVLQEIGQSGNEASGRV